MEEKALKKQKILFVDRDGTLSDDKGAFGKNPSNYEDILKNVSIVSGTKEAIKLAKDNGFLVVLISNQAGIAKGFFKESDFHIFNEKLKNLVDDMIDGYYYCHHHKTGFNKKGKVEKTIRKELIIDCDCRKPKDGMFKQCEFDLENGRLQYIDKNIIDKNLEYLSDDEIYKDENSNRYSRKIFKREIEPALIDKENSYMVGDKVLDIKAGLEYGIKCFLVETGEGIEEKKQINKINGELNKDYFVVKNLYEAVKTICSQ